MGRAPCCEKVGLKRGPWTPEEDQKLVAYINENGHGSWRALPKKAGLLRCGKSCRLRWTNYLRPDIKRGEFSLAEEQTIIQLHALLGNRWSAIASHLPKRTDNEIKNYWNTHLKKKLVKMGLDPCTHKPAADNTLVSSNADPDSNDETGTAGLLLKPSGSLGGSSTTNHMAQWESARLEAEARLKQESQMRAKGLWCNSSGVPNPINVAPLSTRPPWCAAPSNGITNNNTACADTLKALGAVELMHALHNWEKSLQGQAGVMWPEAWRLPGTHFPLREVQAESSSCSSHCSDANTNTSPLGTAGSRRLDHLSPTSTLCTLDSHSIKQKGFQSAIVSGPHSGTHVRKLSWSDALAPLPPKLEMPISLLSSKVVSGFDMQENCCKMEEDSSTFSSLMQEAVFGTDATTNVYMSCLEEDAIKNVSKDVADEGKGGSERGCGADEGGTDAKMFATYQEVCESVVDEGVCEKQSLMDEGVGKDMVVEETCNATLQGTSNIKDSDKESCVEALTDGVCIMEQGGVEKALSASVCEIDTSGDAKGRMVDLNNADSDNNKNNDVKDNDEGKGMGAEVFKDLPKLKSKMSTPCLTSYCALLSEEIPDYWSSIMLKEQQVDMTF